ncbi:MAG: TIGR01777 family oxidoreductase [Candidatus Eiseniibacteriota bacterium]|jgi:hypothetical protein
MHALITGGTGFVGSRLARDLQFPVVLSRGPERVRRRLGDDAAAFAWQPEDEPAPAAAFDDVDVVYHLAGEPLGDARWDAEKKARIQSSRVLGTRNLIRGLAQLQRRPRVLVAASAVGYYGDAGDRELDESAPPGDSFLAGVCRDWEHEASQAAELGIRVVHLRTGIVLGRDGGALARMLPVFRLGLGGKLGDGRQWMPWIHVGDLVELMKFVATHEGVSGPVNAVAPELVTNAGFTRTLGRVLRRPTVLTVPAFALRALFGELADSLLISQRVVPGAAEAAGFQWVFSRLEPALERALGVR